MSIRALLLEASDGQLDATMKPLVSAWADPPTALQILEVLDACIHGAMASGFVVSALQVTYDAACRQEGTTHDEVVKRASWRRAPESTKRTE